MKIEICVDSLESALRAQEGEADRVELCDNLFEGGTTPSAGTIKTARRRLKIGLQVIIRPRGGDFLYTPGEYESMKEDIRIAKDLGADGVVIGLLTADGSIDVDRTANLIEIARPMNVTFHRAFDVCRNPFEALEQLISLSADRLLTSGQKPSVVEGLDLISELNQRANGRIIIMPGCGIDADNVQKVVRESKVEEVHLAVPEEVSSLMTHRNPTVFMGGTLRPPEYSRPLTSPTAVKAVRSNASDIH